MGSAHVTLLESGELEVHHISGTDDGTLTGKSTKLTVNCTPAVTQCIFGTNGEGTDLGALTGGNPAALDGGATVSWLSGTNDEGSFICGSTAKWEGAYEITSPKPLHVAASAVAIPLGERFCVQKTKTRARRKRTMRLGPPFTLWSSKASTLPSTAFGPTLHARTQH